MRDRGLRPDAVYWNTIVSGYAGMQDVGAAVDTVERMQASGYETNAQTLKGLGRLWNRDRLLDALKKVAEPEPAELQTEIERKGEKRAVEVVTDESEADKKWQKEAERYLNDFQLDDSNATTSLESETKEPTHCEEEHKGEQVLMEAAEVEKKPNRAGLIQKDSRFGPSLNATIQKLVGASKDKGAKDPAVAEESNNDMTQAWQHLEQTRVQSLEERRNSSKEWRRESARKTLERKAARSEDDEVDETLRISEQVTEQPQPHFRFTHPTTPNTSKDDPGSLVRKVIPTQQAGLNEAMQKKVTSN